MENFNAQFNWEWEYWLRGSDFPTWYRYYILIKEVILCKSKSILEIGTGSRIIENILKDKVKDYSKCFLRFLFTITRTCMELICRSN